MQKIEKEITVTRYVAMDGSEFETEAECQHYEGSAFGQLVEQLKSCTLNHKLNNAGGHSYILVPRTRHDIFVIGKILQMANEDTQCSDAYGHLCQLDVNLNCNTVAEANLTDLEDYIRIVSNGQYAVVNTTDEDERKQPVK